MSDTAKHRADRCTTHHYACDCREYLTSKRIAELEAKLERLESKIYDAYGLGMADALEVDEHGLGGRTLYGVLAALESSRALD